MNWTSECDGLLIQRWDDNISSSDIAEELDLPLRKVTSRINVLRTRGVPLKKNRKNLIGVAVQRHPDELRDEVLRQIKLGIVRTKIARNLGLTVGKVVGIDYRNREAKKAQEHKALKKENDFNIFFQGQYRITEDEMLEHPELDPRDITGRFFNDPLPGRSALDQRGY